jgi:hypothetical protein
MAIIKPNNNTISAITALPAAIPTGKVLQVKVQQKTADGAVTISGTNTQYADICGGSMTFTPTSSSSNILCILSSGMAEITAGGNCGYSIGLTLSQSGGLSATYDALTDFGFYSLSAILGTGYGNNISMAKSYANSSTNAITITGKGQSYSEGNSNTIKFQHGMLQVMEWIA